MFALILSIPALIKILCVFGLILVLNRLRLSLTVSLFIGSLALGLWMKLAPWLLISSAWFSLTKWQTINLALIVGFIFIMSQLMKESGHLDRIVESFGRLTRDDRIAGAVLPALIGLLPMPGGALFSAPMVDSALCRRPLTGEEKTIVNYWFRHLWEYWWPLYPGVVLAVALLEVDTWRFMVVMFPMALLSVLAGVVFILKPLGKTHEDSGAVFSRSNLGAFLWEIMPISVVVFLILAFAGMEGLMKLAGLELNLPGALPILTGLIASTLWICAVNRVSMNRFRSSLTNRQILPMFLLIFAIMVFKGIMSDSQAVFQIRRELLDYHIPVMLIILIMPFLSGFITGIAIGFVGTSFPLIIPLIYGMSPHNPLAYAAIAYTFGFMGMMLSPVHLCFLVTKDYFEASMIRTYRHLFLPVLTVMVLAGVLFFIYRSI